MPKISQLESATDITANDLIQIVDVEDDGMAPSGTNKKITAQTLGNFLPVTATGSSASRSLKDRFADTVNVKDFGANPLLGADVNTPAIQAAINYASGAASRSCVYFPPGYYQTNAPLVVQAGIHLMGSSRGRTFINALHAGDGIVFQPADAGAANSYLYSAQMSNLSVTRSNSMNTGSAIWIRQCNGFIAQGVEASNHQYGIRISGGQLNVFSDVSTYTGAPFEVNTVGAAILLERADIGGGNFQSCYTVNINNYVGSSNNLLPSIVRIHSADGLSINNAYLGFGSTSLMRFARQTSGDAITGVQVSNCYFDCVDNNRQNGVVVVPRAVQVFNGTSALTASEEGCRQTRFSNCFFANNDGLNNYIIQIQKFSEIQFSNCSFSNASDAGVGIGDTTTDGVPKGRYIITGCIFKNLSEVNSVGQSIIVTDAEHVVINSNLFYNGITTTNQILLTGNLVSGSVIGNVCDASATGNLLSTNGLTVSESLITLNGRDTNVRLNLPTSASSIVSGSMWNDGGVVKVKP